MQGSGSEAGAGGSSGGEFPPETPTGRPQDRPSPLHVVGRLGRPNGMEGFLGIYIDTDDLAYIAPESIVFVAGEPYTVRAVRRGKKGYQVAFAEITSRAMAEEIRGNDVVVAQRRELADNEFWPDDLVGLEVKPGGGTVVSVTHGPSQDRLLIERDGNRFEVPFVDELVPVVDITAGFLEIAEIEGLSSLSDRP